MYCNFSNYWEYVCFEPIEKIISLAFSFGFEYVRDMVGRFNAANFLGGTKDQEYGRLLASLDPLQFKKSHKQPYKKHTKCRKERYMHDHSPARDNYTGFRGFLELFDKTKFPVTHIRYHVPLVMYDVGGFFPFR